MPIAGFSHCLCWSVLASFAHCTSFWFLGFLSVFFRCRICTRSSSPGTCWFAPPVLSVCWFLWWGLFGGLTVFRLLTNRVAFSLFHGFLRLACFSGGSGPTFRPLVRSWRWVAFEEFWSFTSFHKHQGQCLRGFCNGGRLGDFQVLPKELWL